MLKEYLNLKVFVNKKISSNFSDVIIFLEPIFLEEYNALNIRIQNDITLEYFSKFKKEVSKEYDNIIKSFEFIKDVNSNETIIIIYLKDEIEIRLNKIHKIKNNLSGIEYFDVNHEINENCEINILSLNDY